MKKLIISAAIAASSIAVAPETAQAKDIRFQIILGNEQDVRNLCRQYRYSKYNIVNGRKCSDFRPKSKSKPKADETVRSIQKLLNELGYNAGTADGLYGRKTGNALTEFYQSIGQKYDGKADAEELAVLIDFSKNGGSQSTAPSQNTSNDNLVKDAVKQQSGTAWGQSEQALTIQTECLFNSPVVMNN